MARRKAPSRPARTTASRRSRPARPGAARQAARTRSGRATAAGSAKTGRPAARATARAKAGKAGAAKAAGARKRSAAARAPRGTARPASPRKPAAATKRTGAARSAAARPAAPKPPAARTIVARPAAAGRRAAAPPAVPAPKKQPRLDRERRILREEPAEPAGAPSSLDFEHRASGVEAGRSEMQARLDQHHEVNPELTGGDVDANWEDAYFSGDEAPGGDNPTPDQDVVEDIGRALGLEYQDREELHEKVADRDKHRWELDPASSEDYRDRGKK